MPGVSETKLDAAQYVASITEGWRQFFQGRPPATPHSYVYASAWRACTRRMVLDMTSCDKLPAWDAEALANFRRGEDRERDLLADLARIGRNAPVAFQVVGQQERFELRDRKGRVCIVGKRDAEILFADGTRAPLEVKSWSPNTVARIHTFADCFSSPWTRSGAYQLLAYLYGFGRPLGFLLLDRNGLPLPLAVELEPHLEEMEDFMTRAEMALDHAADGSLPDFHRDPEECQRCPFMGAVCNPDLEYSAAQVLADPELAGILERRAELEPAAKEFKALDQQAKDRLENIEMGICGNFLIEGKSTHRKAYQVKASDFWTTKITRV